MNVRWVEEFQPHPKTKEIIHDYESGKLSVRQIMSKYEISYTGFMKLRNKYTDFRRSGNETDNTYLGMKYYSRNRVGNYTIYKTINKKRTCFGTYAEESDAQKVVEFLKQNDWDNEKLDSFLLEENIQRITWRREYKKSTAHNFKYYTLHGDKYRIVKRTNNKTEYYGMYSTEVEAKQVVERLIECDWDKTQLERIKQEIV